jgi:hypothetical protein
MHLVWERYEMRTKFSSKNLKRGYCLKHVGVHGKMVLKWITRNRDQWRTRVHGNEPPGSIKGGEFTD